MKKLAILEEVEEARAEEEAAREMIEASRSHVSRTGTSKTESSGSYVEASNVLHGERPDGESTENDDRAVDGKLPVTSKRISSPIDATATPILDASQSRHADIIDEVQTTRFASTSIATSTKVNQYLNSLDVSPLNTVEAEPLSSTLRKSFPDVTADSFRPLPTPSGLVSTAPSTAAMGYRLFGDGERTVTFRNPITSVQYTPPMMQQPAETLMPTSSPMDAVVQLAKSMEKIAASNSAIHLPKTELVKFSGDAKDYKRFIARFQSNVGCLDIPDNTKLNLLMHYCEGEARELIEDCVFLEDTGLDEALKLLQEEYDKPHKIARSYIDGLTKGPKIGNNDYQAIIDLAKEMSKCYTTLKQLDYMSDLNCTQTLCAITNRLPQHIKTKWMDKAVWYDKLNREPYFYEFADFMKDRAAAYKTTVGEEIRRHEKESKQTKSEEKSKKTESKQTVSRTLATTGNTAESPTTLTKTPEISTQNSKSAPRKKTCTKCSEEHFIADCKSFQAFSVAKRREFCAEKGLCFNCLNLGHRIKDCRTRTRCSECQRKHHSLLHTDQQDVKKDASDSTEKKEASATTMCAWRKKSIFFPIVAVRVQHGGKSIDTRAVLDQCSDVNLCTERLLKQLNIDGPRKPFTVNTVTGTKTDLNSVATQLMISAIDESTTINVKDVRSVPQLPVNFSSMADSKNLHEFSHLQNIQLPHIDNEHVDILIGSGCTQAFIVEDQAVGAPGEPYAAKYPLGWTIIGPSKRSSNEPATVNLQHEVTNEQLSSQIQAMWNHDCKDLASNKTVMSIEDKIAVDIAEKSIRKVRWKISSQDSFQDQPETDSK